MFVRSLRSSIAREKVVMNRRLTVMARNWYLLVNRCHLTLRLCEVREQLSCLQLIQQTRYHQKRLKGILKIM